MRYTSNSTMSDAQVKAFGINCYRLRKKEGLNQTEFGEMVGATGTHISNIERGVKKCSPELASKIADMFNMTLDDMFDEPLADCADRKSFAKSLIRRREDKGLSVNAVAAFLGIKLARYLEYERAQTYPAKSERDKLDMLLGKPAPPVVKADTVEPKVIERTAEIPYEIIDVILKHVKDLNVSTDIQKTVYRYFSKVKLENEERRLFG